MSPYWIQDYTEQNHVTPSSGATFGRSLWKGGDQNHPIGQGLSRNWGNYHFEVVRMYPPDLGIVPADGVAVTIENGEKGKRTHGSEEGR